MMAKPVDALLHGTWVTRDRIVAYPAIMLALTVAASIYVLWTNDGLLPSGAPFGSDFVSYWIAARQALAGNPLVPYERALFEPAQAALFPGAGYFAFYYPPHYLAYMLPLGALPFYAALIVWMAASFAAAAWVLTNIAGNARHTVILAMAFPAAFLTIAHGQNAFLSAALFGGALLALPGRPVLAGILLGLLTFKPQLGLLIPLALLAAGQWRAIIAAGATLSALGVASAVLFGVNVWPAFLAQSDLAVQTMTQGWVAWEKMISIYAGLRVVGTSHDLSLALHGVVAAMAATATIWAWLPASGVAHGTRNALLITGALIATPFGLNYDLYLLAPAMAFLAQRGLTAGFLPLEKTIMAIIFAVPFVLMAAMAAQIPIAPPLLVAFFALIARRALHEHASEHTNQRIQPAE